MNYFVLFPIASILCFFVAILFFRNENIQFEKVFFPFFMSLLSPRKMKQYLKIEGIILIAIGYASFIIFMFIDK